jgi:hypothetical protein
VRAFLLSLVLAAANAGAQSALDQLRLVGAARLHDGRVRLTPAREQVAGAAWGAEKQDVAGGFDTEFHFQLTGQGGLGHGADGFAFVLQNAGPNALAGRGSSGGFALGDGWGDRTQPGIPHSVAVFFDTYRNPGEPSNNYIAVCTNGAIGSMRWPPPRLAVSKKLKPRLKDGQAHTARVVYDPPVLTVSVDDGPPVVRAIVDLATILDERGAAYVGFTASTGAGYENHDILDWQFNPHATSAMFVVQSGIDFLKTNCLEGKNLCTPAEASVEPRGPGEFHVVLPANREWGASVPNPDGREVEITGARGMVCGALRSGEDCSDPRALISKQDNGRTWFSVDGRKGEYAANQGFFEFDVRLK